MPRTGRPPKPVAMHKAVGSYRPHRHGTAHPEPDTSAPDCPAWVTGPAREHWGQIVPMLAGMGVMADVHVTALCLLVDALGRYIKLRDEVEATGYTSTTDKGNLIQHPLVGAMNKAWEQVLKACREFGMTPAAINGLGKTNTEDKDQPKDGKRRFFDPKLTG